MAKLKFLLLVLLCVPSFGRLEKILEEGIYGRQVLWHIPAEVQFPDRNGPVEGIVYLTETRSALIPPQAYFEPLGSDEDLIPLPRIGLQLSQIYHYKTAAVIPGTDRERRAILQHLALSVSKHRAYYAAGFSQVIAEDYLEIEWVDGDYEILNAPFPQPDKHRSTRRITISEVNNPFRKESFCHRALTMLSAILF